jgi:proton-dependent oligopeptide transporter, POT family
MSTDSSARMPGQIPYIIGNEACERFSFYGMRNILVPFLIGSVMLNMAPLAEREGIAKDIFHSFVIGVYFFPLLGGWLSDRFFGKYQTILWLSLVYCVGHLCLALFESNATGFYVGLFLIALGSGGIKPLVSAFVGDQFTQHNKHLAKIVYDVFYWTINFGSFFASLLMPRILKEHGAAWAFGIPGILMAIATLIYWLGRHKYVRTAPTARDEHGFLAVSKDALFTHGLGAGSAIACFGMALALFFLGCWIIKPAFWQLGFVLSFCLSLIAVMLFGGIGVWMQLDRARKSHSMEAVEAVRAVLRILIVFALVTPFWSLFDQKASTWVIQGKAMQMFAPDSWLGWLVKEPAQMQALNPLLVMLLIPFNNLVLYPFLKKIGIEPSPLRRMGFGIAVSGLAWIAAGMIQLQIDGGEGVSIAWQILPYALLTFGEVLVSATGLEFAYSQAPASMKGSIMSFWLLAVTVGNVWVLLTNAGMRQPAFVSWITSSGLSQNAFLMFFFAGFALITALIFALYARRYPMQDYYRQ